MRNIKMLICIFIISFMLGFNALNIVYAFNEENTNQENSASTVISEKENKIKSNEYEETKVEVLYEYNSSKNTVLVTMKSNNELQDTKVSWRLSADKKSYTYEFKANTTYTTTVTDIYGNVIHVDINVTQITEVEVYYKYNSEANTVIATMISSNELQDTKVSWTLSEDRKSYTYEFKSNTKYTTTVTDIYGNVINVLIEITQIPIPETKINVYYKYNSSNNTVLVTMESNNQLQNTKVSWNLSEDKKNYTYEFKANTTYTTTVTDIYGNIINVDINVTQITEVEVYYEYNSETNTVLATMKSNNELQDTKISWNLSEDKKSYTYEFSNNTTYTTTVTDVYGNIIKVDLNINQIDDKAPKITLEYIYNEDDTVTVILHSNETLGETKPTWTLSEDKLSYSKIYNEDIEYSTSVQDIYGNEMWVKIRIETKIFTYTSETGLNITVKYLYDSYDQVTVKIVSDIELKDTKPTWVLSEDKKTYTKVFTTNNIYKTLVEDINGNQMNVSIIVNYFKDTYKGIDVSEYQKIINWTAVKRSGIDFTFIRAGYRGWGSNGTLVTDRYFSTNIKEATKVGMDIGIYFYTQAITEEEAREEARYTLNLISQYNVPIKYPIVIDTERTPVGTGRADGISKEQRTKVVKAFCEEIKSAGYKAMIYANKNWLIQDLDINELENYEIWLAHYTTLTDYQYPYAIWQYTSSGSVDGIVGNVDMNIGYKKY